MTSVSRSSNSSTSAARKSNSSSSSKANGAAMDAKVKAAKTGQKSAANNSASFKGVGQSLINGGANKTQDKTANNEKKPIQLASASDAMKGNNKVMNDAAPIGAGEQADQSKKAAEEKKIAEQKRNDSLNTLKTEANAQKISEALLGKNNAIEKMSESEQKQIVQDVIKTWDNKKDPASANTLLNGVKSDPKTYNLVKGIYQQYGSDKLAQQERAENGEFKNKFAEDKDKSFLGGCLADSTSCSMPPVNKAGESVVISGQDGQSHKIDDHFLINGYARAYEQRQMGKETTWIVYSGDDKEQIAEYKDKAQKADINFKVFSNRDDVTNYINNKNGDQDPRAKKPISNLIYVGHGLGGNWAIDYSKNKADPRFNKHLDASQIKADAFMPNALINFNASCNAARSKADEYASVLQQMQRLVGPDGVISGAVGIVNFGTWPVDTDQEVLDQNRSLRFYERWFASPKHAKRVIVHGAR